MLQAFLTIFKDQNNLLQNVTGKVRINWCTLDTIGCSLSLHIFYSKKKRKI